MQKNIFIIKIPIKLIINLTNILLKNEIRITQHLPSIINIINPPEQKLS